MIAYRYRALDSGSGRIHKGRITAANENELCFLLKEMDLELIEAKAQTPAASGLRLMRPRVTMAEKISLCRHLADLLASGLPFAQALSCIIDAQSAGAFKDRLVKIQQGLRGGDDVAAAFAAHPDLFSPLFLTLLGAGEKSGDLQGTFARLADQLTWQEQVARELRHALRYPLFLLSIACVVTSFMMVFVIPQLTDFLASLEGELPLSTRLLIGTANAFRAGWWVVPVALTHVFMFAAFARRFSPALVCLFDRILLAAPFIGSILTQFALARFTTSFSLLIKAGLSFPQAFAIAARTAGNRALENDLIKTGENLQTGQSLSHALTPFFPAFPLQILKVGEKSGAVTTALDDIAKSFEREAERRVKDFLGLLEPTLTLVVGALLAWVVLAVLGPVYGSLSTLSASMR